MFNTCDKNILVLLLELFEKVKVIIDLQATEKQMTDEDLCIGSSSPTHGLSVPQQWERDVESCLIVTFTKHLWKTPGV
jgi:hypothetical protein